MLKTYENPTYEYRRSSDQDSASPAHHPVIVVGAGPVGLVAALDLAQKGHAVVVLDDDNTVSVGSRAVCHAKRTLEILDRLGVGQRMVDKGVTWNLGKVFFREQQIYSFDLLPEKGHKRPAFINLQQYYFEEYLVDHAGTLPNVDLRWQSKVVAIEPRADGVALEVETPDGRYALTCDYLVAADGSKSPLREMMGLKPKGQVFQDYFLITDVVMKAGFPPERWFWFDPPFNPGMSSLLHRQADDVWRLDFQLGQNADKEAEGQVERVLERVKAMLGDDTPFELEWISVYTFRCRRLERFRHGRVLFAGDAAHTVSPFGARGGNAGVQDADNLAWKLDLVLKGKAPEALLDSYGAEREYAADVDIMNSTRSTDFITPKSDLSRTFRDAVLELAAKHPFARRLVNSGRLSVATVLRESPLSTSDWESFKSQLVPGSPCADAPVRMGGRTAWLLDQLGGAFQGLYFAGEAPTQEALAMLASLREGAIPIEMLVVSREALDLPEEFANIVDAEGRVAERYDGRAGTFYLLRPDQHVAARWRRLDAGRVRAALDRATARGASSARREGSA
jgi:3-(3-hydroxy-phenyl)propionate hydroxylase